jgi:hypothetical protein
LKVAAAGELKERSGRQVELMMISIDRSQRQSFDKVIMLINVWVTLNVYCGKKNGRLTGTARRPSIKSGICRGGGQPVPHPEITLQTNKGQKRL